MSHFRWSIETTKTTDSMNVEQQGQLTTTRCMGKTKNGYLAIHVKKVVAWCFSYCQKNISTIKKIYVFWPTINTMPDDLMLTARVTAPRVGSNSLFQPIPTKILIPFTCSKCPILIEILASLWFWDEWHMHGIHLCCFFLIPYLTEVKKCCLINFLLALV